MKQRILDSFPSCVSDNCFHIESSQKFKVFDRDDECCYICKDEEPESLAYFTVENPNEKEIHFLAIDRCIMPGSESKKCDCAIFDDNLFCFVEIKVITSSKKRSTRKIEAYEQLKATIGHFKEKIEFESYLIDAYICCGSNNINPRCNSAKMGRAKELFDLYEANLVEGNKITFQ